MLQAWWRKEDLEVARRGPDKEVLAAMGLGFAMVLGLLAVADGLWPWAIVGGVVVAGAMYWFTREWRAAGVAGCCTIAALLLLGGISVLMSG